MLFGRWVVSRLIVSRSVVDNSVVSRLIVSRSVDDEFVVSRLVHLRGEILTSKIITKKNFEVTNIFTEVPEENHQILSFFK